MELGANIKFLTSGNNQISDFFPLNLLSIMHGLYTSCEVVVAS